MGANPEILSVAIQQHQAGRLELAEQAYRRILEIEPDHIDALHLLGLVSSQTGNHQLAVDCISRALTMRPDWAEANYNLGNALRGQRKLGAAGDSYRRALALKPEYVDAHVNLGNTLQDQGKLDAAVLCYRRALKLRPDLAVVYNNLGNALGNQGKHDEAVASYRRALELTSDNAEAHNNLGNALTKLGQLDEAIVVCHRALQLDPDFTAAHNNLGNALAKQERLDEAVACYRRALNLNPDLVEVRKNLDHVLERKLQIQFEMGNDLLNQGNLESAVTCYLEVLELQPGNADAHINLGNALKEQGKLDDAIACYCRALELKPDYAAAHNNLGNALKDQGKLEEAIARYRRALVLNPALAEAHSNLANAFREQGKLDEAVECCQRALELRPGYAEAHNNLGNALKDQGNLAGAMASYRRAVELKPNDACAHSNLLMALHYGTGITPQALADAHAEFDRRCGAPSGGVIAPHEKRLGSKRRLRVGFVSPDFRRHPVGYFLIRLLEELSPERLETVCFSDCVVKDDMTRRLQKAAAHWRDVAGISSERLAEQIRSERIDILFDLAGHTGNNRLPVFARKPAPIQITWAGYVGTTGLAAMDYLLADLYEVPPGAEKHYCERILRMPNGYVCYDPPADAPAVTALPALDRGTLTFSCFNNPAKITREIVEVWARILRRLPQARLVLKYKGWNDSGAARRVTEMFLAHGIDRGRLELHGSSPHAEFLAEYRHIDVALDSYPYSGGLTTCESLWMGVPVITCPGATFASRHSLSHLSNVGLTEMIVQDLDEYENLAVSLASDLLRLAALRARLRERMAASPLCDGKRFAGDFASLLQSVWDQGN